MTDPRKIPFQKVAPKRIIDEITHQIKEMIYSGALEPNDRLPSEKELATSFGTGRMTVREALRMLEAVGFIYIKQGAEGGAFVKELDASTLTSSIEGLLEVGNVSLEEITETRIFVECQLLESAIANVDDKQIKALEDNLALCKKEKNDIQNDHPPAGLTNFHLLLADASKNQLLKYFLHALIDLSTNYVVQNIPDLPLSPTHIKEHEDILSSLKAHNLDSARNALRTHLIASAEQIDQAIKVRHSND